MLPDKPARKSVTIYGLALILAGVFVPAASRLIGLPFTADELKDIRVELVGTGLVVAGWGFRSVIGSIKQNGNGVKEVHK